MPLKASTIERREKSRLKPCRGLMRLNLGLIASVEKRSLVWKKVTEMASSAVTKRKGPAIKR